jgi:hypothetical protein
VSAHISLLILERGSERGVGEDQMLKKIKVKKNQEARNKGSGEAYWQLHGNCKR